MPVRYQTKAIANCRNAKKRGIAVENNNKKNPVLGIIGGLGPMATVYFYEMLTSKTAAACDQDHIDIVISSKASTPDRTAFIMGESKDDPLCVMIEEAKKLEEYGASMIVMPCNTAHYFYDELHAAVKIPFINIIDETVSYCKKLGYKKVGILATEGTIMTKGYQMRLEKAGIEYEIPSPEMQQKVTELIYDDIKQGKRADMNKFSEISAELTSKGCRSIILGCTELSMIKRDEKLGRFYTDSLEVLAYSSIVACGKTPVVNFPC